MISSIAELWYGNLAPMEVSGKTDPQLQQVEKLLLRNGQKLEEMLEGKAKELFLRYHENETEYVSRSNEQAFRDGFSLAAKLITEALCATQPEQ